MNKPRTKATPVQDAGLSARQHRFVAEYLVDLNASAAARRAGYSAKTADRIAFENLRKPEIASAIAKAQKEVGDRLQINAERVVSEAWNVLTADPRELVEFRVGCCRHCWGAGHRYQRTAGELERDREAFAQLDQKRQDAVGGAFDEKGGAGFDARRDPHPDCPECFGDGVGRTKFNDTRTISPAAASLYAGTKQTRDGVEVKLHSKLDALEKVMRHLGLYDRVRVPEPAAQAIAGGAETSLADRGRAILAALVSGGLQAGHAGQLLTGLGTLAKLIESDELEARIAALEQQGPQGATRP